MEENHLDNTDIKFEEKLFGNKVNYLTYGGNNFLFGYKNWDVSLKILRDGFLKNNVVKKEKELKNELKYVKEDDNVRELFKYIEYNNIFEELRFQAISYASGYLIQNPNFVA